MSDPESPPEDAPCLNSAIERGDAAQAEQFLRRGGYWHPAHCEDVARRGDRQMVELLWRYRSQAHDPIMSFGECVGELPVARGLVRGAAQGGHADLIPRVLSLTSWAREFESADSAVVTLLGAAEGGQEDLFAATLRAARPPRNRQDLGEDFTVSVILGGGVEILKHLPELGYSTEEILRPYEMLAQINDYSSRANSWRELATHLESLGGVGQEQYDGLLCRAALANRHEIMRYALEHGASPQGALESAERFLEYVPPEARAILQAETSAPEKEIAGLPETIVLRISSDDERGARRNFEEILGARTQTLEHLYRQWKSASSPYLKTGRGWPEEDIDPPPLELGVQEITFGLIDPKFVDFVRGEIIEPLDRHPRHDFVVVRLNGKWLDYPRD